MPQTSQFCGLRDVVVTDPDGYVLTFSTPIKLESCPSCGMSHTDAEPCQMYCAHCVDEKEALRPFEQVFEGTTRGDFSAHLTMPADEARRAAGEQLAKMPARASRT